MDTEDDTIKPSRVNGNSTTNNQVATDTINNHASKLVTKSEPMAPMKQQDPLPPLPAKKAILCVGLCCLDVIIACKDYPKEDTKDRGRVVDHRWQLGGNVGITLAALAKLNQPNNESCNDRVALLKRLIKGTDSNTQDQEYSNSMSNKARIEWLGCLATDHAASFLVDNLRYTYGISMENVVMHENAATPISYVLLNTKNGSRTIMHYNKNLPELKLSDFKKVDLSQYGWIHFDGRNREEVRKMIRYIRTMEPKSSRIKLSIQLEKRRIELKEFFDEDIDYFIVEKDFVQELQCETPMDCLKVIPPLIKSETACIIVPWSDKGAFALDKKSGDMFHSPAYTPKAGVIDTLGAGDTFAAALINALHAGQNLEAAIRYACKIASAKCGIVGFGELNRYEELIQPPTSMSAL